MWSAISLLYFYGHLQKIFKEIGISEFSYKTRERGYDRDDVKEILHRIYVLTQKPISDKEHNFSIDGTGLSISMDRYCCS
ncbi:MAG: hypothetical protein PVF58_16475 [Candidatus Methanofastidiosia archaeon]